MIRLGLVLLYFTIGVSLGSRRRELWEDQDLPIESHHLELHHNTFRGDVRRLSVLQDEITPLFQGYGTHFAYIYVGTPPQRQSVIIDTGSHLTAFPCTGCKNCGKHTDPYYNPKASSSSSTIKCKKLSCVLSQAYAEGSSWKAVQMEDKLWVGGLTEREVEGGNNYSIPFRFGCQTSETGLFVTQMADGIMGMSASLETLPSQLEKHKVLASRTFALCFRVGGGIMTLGGVNQLIHARPSIIKYAMQVHSGASAWFTVVLRDILMRDRMTGHTTPLKLDPRSLNSGKGVIVDSGTTDTYLPKSINAKFQKVFMEVSGVSFSNRDMKLTPGQLSRLPDLIFVFTAEDGKSSINIEMPWSNYVDKAKSGSYAMRIYNTETAGAVLGANFMNGQNVIFDRDNDRIGFAPSSCKFDDSINSKVANFNNSFVNSATK